MVMCFFNLGGKNCFASLSAYDNLSVNTIVVKCEIHVA